MTPDEALDRLQSTYHSPLLGVVREELERLRARVAELTAERRTWIESDDQIAQRATHAYAQADGARADLAAARALLDDEVRTRAGFEVEVVNLRTERDEARALLREATCFVNSNLLKRIDAALAAGDKK